MENSNYTRTNVYFKEVCLWHTWLGSQFLASPGILLLNLQSDPHNFWFLVFLHLGVLQDLLKKKRVIKLLPSKLWLSCDKKKMLKEGLFQDKWQGYKFYTTQKTTNISFTVWINQAWNKIIFKITAFCASD